MFNSANKFINTKKLFYFCLTLSILISSFFVSKINSAPSARALIGPISVVGEVSVPEQQILFNHLRKKLNKRYHLVSHKMLELITEHGISSIDIEDCADSKCVRTVQNFVNNLRQQFNTDELFLFQVVQSKTETQLSLKLASLSLPEVTRRIVTQTCRECDIEKLMQNVDIIVQRMLEKIAGEEVTPSEEAVATEKVAPSKEEIALPDEADQPASVERLEIVEEKTPVAPAPDPYIVDRDSYNQQISKLLLDVTYALQIFRSGMFVQIEVSIDPYGSVVKQRIIKSSGSRDFDETAIISLEEIQFDPLPETMLKYGNYVVILQIQNSR